MQSLQGVPHGALKSAVTPSRTIATGSLRTMSQASKTEHGEHAFPG